MCRQGLTTLTCADNCLCLEEELRELVSAAFRDEFLCKRPVPFLLPVEIDSQELGGRSNRRANGA